MRKHIALGAALFLGTGSALAADEMSYNLMEFGYGYTDIKNSSVHGDTFSLSGSFAFGESFFGFGRASSTDVGGYDSPAPVLVTALQATSVKPAGISGSPVVGASTVKGLSLGLGFHAPVSSSVDFVGALSFELADAKGASSETGFGASVGLRGRATDKLELNGGVGYVDYGSGADGVAFTVGSRYYLTEAFAAGIDLSMDDKGDSTTFGIGFRYDFGY
jgi:hypothetical protein